MLNSEDTKEEIEKARILLLKKIKWQRLRPTSGRQGTVMTIVEEEDPRVNPPQPQQRHDPV